MKLGMKQWGSIWPGYKSCKLSTKQKTFNSKWISIPHAQNEEVDLLSWLTLEEMEQLPQEVLVETISQASFERPVPIMNVHSGPSWMDPFIRYLDQGELPTDKDEAKKISAKVRELSVWRCCAVQKREVYTVAQVCRAGGGSGHNRRNLPRHMQHSWRDIHSSQ